MAGCIFYYKGFFDYSENYFKGKGSLDNPYLIENYSDLITFQQLVNEGHSFDGVYFLQTANIDLENKEWTPIGIYASNKYFSGTYDGGGYYIENLLISDVYPYSPANVGFFGFLDGTVKNFGIESGSISGDYIGSIASHGSDRSLILNCYSKANLNAAGRAGGICDNLSGKVINCVFTGNMKGYTTGIISYNSSMAIGIYPDVLPITFCGTLVQVNLTGDNPCTQLNNGINELIERGILNRKDVRIWR